jgi:hypothetical protein
LRKVRFVQTGVVEGKICAIGVVERKLCSNMCCGRKDPFNGCCGRKDSFNRCCGCRCLLFTRTFPIPDIMTGKVDIVFREGWQYIVLHIVPALSKSR